MSATPVVHSRCRITPPRLRPCGLAVLTLAVLTPRAALATDVPFEPQSVISTSADDAFAVFAADVDGDGDTDVLSASFTDDTIAWYENLDGAGTFGPQQVISADDDGARSVFVTGALCVEANGADTTSVDAENPLPGQAFYYIVSPENGCPSNPGCLDPACLQRPARDC